MNNLVQMHRSIPLILVTACLISLSSQITKYDFNVCRIKFCAQKQASCVADQSTCMDAFAKTRTCFQTCTNADQLETYNKCWTSCKQGNAYFVNALYYEVSQCYESVCYLGGSMLTMAGLALLLIIFMMV